jgi:Na+/pantothenate symporter
MAAVIAIGVWYAKKANKSTEDYFLGGRTLGPWVSAMSAEASDMSGWLLMGLPGLAYWSGLADAGWTAIGLALGTYLNWLITSKRLRRYSERIGAITIPHMTDIGLPAAFVATTPTVSSLVLTVSKFAVGFSYDKRGLRFTLMFCHATALIAFVLKALLTNSTLGMVMAITASCAASFALPLETVMIPLLTSDLFGSASYAKVLGVFMAMNSLGLCLGSPLGNLYYDISKTYIPCFWLFAVLMVVVAIGFQLLIRVANKDKERILAAQAEEAETV